MELVTPGIGLLFWMLLSFSIVLVLLKKFAWKPILNTLEEREDSIQKALLSAEQARSEVAELKSQKEKILNEAKLEREKIIRLAHEETSAYKQEQKIKIDEQFKLKISSAIDEINQQKRSAMEDLKKTVAKMSVDIAEKILEKELENVEQHDSVISDSVKGLDV
tara:strand:+ start:419 stop:910 length:492 start_codon:yes stop_codon:yes gene_type:complete